MRIFLCVLALLLAAPAQAEERLYMRVVARSNSLPAQTEKLLIRNLALLMYPLAPGSLSRLEEWVPGCRVEMRKWQPCKEMPPASTVYITLGQGQGRNWWGVLFPGSACWAYGGGEGGEARVVFPVVRWLLGLFSLF